MDDGVAFNRLLDCMQATDEFKSAWYKVKEEKELLQARIEKYRLALEKIELGEESVTVKSGGRFGEDVDADYELSREEMMGIAESALLEGAGHE